LAKEDSNPWESEPPQENEKLRDLVRDLAHAINTVFAESTEIKTVIKDIEQEGYTVDLVLASITRALGKEQKPKNNVQIEPPGVPDAEKFELNRFDQSFLKSIKIRPEAEGD
jgi:regulator of replication initiation timing